jgi:uncharacterized protein
MADAMAAVHEQPFFIDVGSEKLFAMWHAPAAQEPSRAVILCHALAEEKLWSHRAYVTLSRELAARGIAVLRPDFRGEGESDREFEQSSLATRLVDLRHAVGEVQKRCPGVREVMLLGHRFGCTVAAAYAASDAPAVAGLILWDPILDGREYISQLLRSHLTTQLAVHGRVTRSREELFEDILAGRPVAVEGYPLTREFVRELVELDWIASFPELPRGALLVEVAKAGQKTPSERLASLSSRNSAVECVVVEAPPFWRETRQFHRRAAGMTDATLTWLGLNR